jgi:hypothetical protein
MIVRKKGAGVELPDLREGGNLMPKFSGIVEGIDQELQL